MASETQTKEIVRYEKPHRMLISLIRYRGEKHYSYNIDEKVFVAYSKDIKPSIHLKIKNVKSNNSQKIGELDFVKYTYTIEVCIEYECEDKDIEVYEFSEFVSKYYSERKAWAVFFSHANRLRKSVSDYEFVVGIIRGKKPKWDMIVLYAIPKHVLKEFDDYIMSRISKYLAEQGIVEEKLEEEHTQLPNEAEELELEEAKLETSKSRIDGKKEEPKVEEIAIEEKVEEVKVEEKKEEEKKVEELALEEKPEIKPEEKPSKTELVQLYLLSFELPSYSLATMLRETELDLQTKILKEVNYIESELKKKIENLRRYFYSQCDKLFETSTLGWVTVSEEGIKFANEWNERFRSALVTFANTLIAQKVNQASDPKLKELYTRLQNKLIARANKRIVKAVKVYIEPEDAKEILNEIVNKISDEIEEFKRRIEEAEKQKEEKKAKWLMRELTLKELKLKMFKDVLSKIS